MTVTWAIVLAAGQGTRMGGNVPKQYIEVMDRPLLYYTLKAVEGSSADRVVIVTDREHMRYVLSDIVDKYNFKKVVSICEGGRERPVSVLHGLDDIKEQAGADDIVLIHDGARACISSEAIDAVRADVFRYGAAIAAMPCKDTIKISDRDGFIRETTDRSLSWQAQTPQGFLYGEISAAYLKAMERDISKITDDAQVWNMAFPDRKIKLTQAGYDNIKVTTPEDMILAEQILSHGSY